MERDVVWTLQKHLIATLREQHLPYAVFNDFPMVPGKHRALSADLVIVNRDGVVEVAAGFKYEPSLPSRPD